MYYSPPEARSASVKLTWNVSRWNKRLAYSCKGFASGGRRMPMDFKRHNMGAIAQSTKENSSLKKNGISLNMGETEIKLSRNAFLADSTALGSVLVKILFIRAYQSRLTLCNIKRLLALAT